MAFNGRCVDLSRALTRVPASGVADNIPVIDLSGAFKLEPLESVLSDTVTAIGKACEEWGFFQVINHGVPMETRARVFSASKSFFDLPNEEKRKVRRDFENPLGFYESEHTKNMKDWKEVFDFTVEEPAVIPWSPDPNDGELRDLQNQWPDNPPGFRAECRAYAEEMVKLAHKLTELICLSLNLPKDYLRGSFKDQTSFLRLNYYPPCPDTSTLAVGPHKDYSAMTILTQDDVPGLEVFRRSTGEWNLVMPVADALVVNVGDVFQVWSNDRYYSVDHRARSNLEVERRSLAFFFDPSHYVEVKPIDELLVMKADGADKEEIQAKYKAYNYGKFYSHRRLTDFKKFMDNIQIENFKI